MMRKTFMSVVGMFCSLLMLSCNNNIQIQPFRTLPQDAQSVVFKDFEKALKSFVYCQEKVEMKDFKIVSAEKLELSNADNANNYKEKWKVDIGVIWKCPDSDWKDNMEKGWEVLMDGNGQWFVKRY